MTRSAVRAAALILSALLLTSCAVNLRPAEPVIPDDPAPETVSAEPVTDPSVETEGETEEPAPETNENEVETEAPETDAPEDVPSDDPEPEEPDPGQEEPEPEDPESEPEPEPEEPNPFSDGAVRENAWIHEGLKLRFVLPGDDWRFADQRGTDADAEALPDGTFYAMQAQSEAGSTVLIMGRRIPEPGDGEESVTLAEYVRILAEGMTESGGEDVSVEAGEPEEAELAGETWLLVPFRLVWPGEAESRSLWYTREWEGWFVTAAVTASPADRFDAETILSMLTAPDAPLPEKPGVPDAPAVFAWGSDSLESGSYKNPFAGIRVTAAEGWTFMTETELAKRNDLHVAADADSREIAEAADRESARCVMHLENGDGASMELSFIRAEAFGEGGWEQYAGFLVDNLLKSGEAAGFSMSATDGEWAELAGERWFVRIVTYSAGGYAVGQRMLLWRPAEGELAELTLDNGVWTDIPLTSMTAMISREEPAGG